MNKYTSAQTANLLGVSRRTLERWRTSGKFVPEFKTLGGHSRYSEEQINQIKSNDDPVDIEDCESKGENCVYSKAINQPYPRRCVKCGKQEQKENININNLL